MMPQGVAAGRHAIAGRKVRAQAEQGAAAR
jgi:hypothetical protein